MSDRLRFIAAGACVAVAIGLGFLRPTPGIDMAPGQAQSTLEMQPNPADFSVEELQILQRRFGVHGP